MVNILVVALLAMICAGKGWEDIEEFGLAKEAWLGTFLDLRNGTPSADTFRRALVACARATPSTLWALAG